MIQIGKTLVWFITGVSSGFGRALALEVASGGDIVIGTVRNEADRIAFNALVPGHTNAVLADVTHPESLVAAVDQIVKTHNRIDVVVNNAGFGMFGAFEEMSNDELRAQMETNFFGVLNVSKAVLPVFRTQRFGHFLNMSSVSGQVGMPGLSIYNASKWALEGFSESLAKEVATFGVRVTILEPGAFRTDWAGRSMSKTKESEDYRESVGPIRAKLASVNGKQPGDPRKAAQVMMKLVRLDKPPLRIPLGSDCYQAIKLKLGTQLEALHEWESLSRSTDFVD